jgi:hypothetical protein
MNKNAPEIPAMIATIANSIRRDTTASTISAGRVCEKTNFAHGWLIQQAAQTASASADKIAALKLRAATAAAGELSR